MSEPTKDDLSLVTTSDMLEELSKRNDALVVGAMQLNHDGPGEHHYMRYWTGGALLCSALTRLLSVRLDEALNRMDVRNDEEIGDE